MSVREHLVKVYECSLCGATYATEAGGYACVRVHDANAALVRAAELSEPEHTAVRETLLDEMRIALCGLRRPLHDAGLPAPLYEPAPERVS